MANGITLNAGSGGKTVETTELANGRQVESVQLAIIVAGVAVPITEDNPLPVSVPGGIVGAYGKKGLFRADMSGGDVVLDVSEAAFHLIIAEGATIAGAALEFPDVPSDDECYTRLVRNTGAGIVTIRSGANEYELNPGDRLLLDFEPTQVIPSINAV